MSGFNLAELLPYYLDETDEHIAELNDALLRLEQEPTDARALQEAFRMFHSIKGASVVMGFQPVNQLTHQLENLFDQLRTKKRVLDRPLLDLTFRCLDELRDYHRDLRSQGHSAVDLSGLLAEVVDYLNASITVVAQSGTAGQLQPEPLSLDPAASEGVVTLAATPPVASAAVPEPMVKSPPAPERFEESGILTLIVIFEPNLPLADMKARLVLNRLSARARILSTDPPVERLDEAEPLASFKIRLTTECDVHELRTLADVAGVAEILIEAAAANIALSRTEARPRAPVEPGSNPPSRAQEPSPSLPTTVAASAAPSLTGSEPSVLPADLGPVQSTVPGAKRPAAERLGAPATANPVERSRKAKVAETIRVESDRLDHLMNLAGELVITKARFVAITHNLEELFRRSNSHVLSSDTRERTESIVQGLEELTTVKTSTSSSALDRDRWLVHVRALHDDFHAIQQELGLIRDAHEHLKALSEAVHSLGRVSDGLQKGVLDTRMVPIGPLFERFRRVIRDLSLASGKEVVLQITGEKTELDKRMIDELSDPLIHMVRNAVDHGLEPPNEREAAGKPRAGTVILSASHRGNSVVITVSDNGRGIDCKRIRHKIIAKGLVRKTEADELSDRELISFIWHPGLSTAETVTEISGRGVGMDIVKNRIENLNGTVDVRSIPGQGTTFTIRLPLTLAIMLSLLVRIYDEVYAIPLDHIDEIVEIRPSQMYWIQGRAVIEIRKKIVALVSLGDVFRWGDKHHPSVHNGINPRSEEANAGHQTREKHTVVVVQDGETTIGLLVDELIGMQEIVLKSLEKNFRAIPGLSGASILGNGQVCLILDLDAVIDLVGQRPTNPSNGERSGDQPGEAHKNAVKVD
jgi:two-component system, chemotaxis family, sensor kinase CheA